MAILVCTAPSTAKHKTATPQTVGPAHNFIGVDLNASIPDAPSPRHMDVKLLDTVTATRSGDTVTFDVLTISKSFGHYMSGTTDVGPPEGTIMHARLLHEILLEPAMGPTCLCRGKPEHSLPASVRRPNSDERRPCQADPARFGLFWRQARYAAKMLCCSAQCVHWGATRHSVTAE